MKKYNFVVDAGNTNVVFAVYYQDSIIRTSRVETKKYNCHSYYEKIIKYLLREIEADISVSAISSVVPEITGLLVSIIQSITSAKCEVIDYSSHLGLSFPMKDNSHIGSDLILNAFTAKEKYQSNCIICDLGTATTIQLVSKSGLFYGASILPGIKTASHSLFQKASKLKEIELENPQNILGTTTREALLSGIIFGHRFVLEGFIDRIKREYCELNTIKVIVTGGLSDLICANLEFVDHIDKNLLLDGLNIICNMHRS